MDIQYYKDRLKEMSSRAVTEKHIRNLYPELYDYLIYKYPSIPFKEKLYWFINDITSFPVCEFCGNPVTFINSVKGYHRFCSYSCSTMGTREQVKQTCLDRYGDPNYNNRDGAKQTINQKTSEEQQKTREKIIQTFLKKYGVSHPVKNEEIKRKIFNTKKEKYGDPHFNNKKKALETINHYTNEQKQNILDKRKKTNIEKYGVENPFQSKEIQEKIKNTLLEKYGVEYAQQSLEIQETRKKNSLKKYGVEHHMLLPEVHEKALQRSRETIMRKNPNLLGYTEDGDNILVCPHDEKYKTEHSECLNCPGFYIIGSDQRFARQTYSIEPCTRIRPIGPCKNKGTTLEIYIRKLLDSWKVKYECNNRSILDGQELDIYIPDKNIAIECNGLFWHSTFNKDPKYHYRKWKDCKDQNIQLLTLWEDWIRNKSEIVESILKNKLGVCENTIYARKCSIKEISGKQYIEFLDKNHIQGSVKNTSIRFGLYYNDKLVSAMGFSKKGKSWILNRFCNERNIRVAGGASRLLKHFISIYNPIQVISYSSNDISDGRLYQKLGFSLSNENNSYWYIDKNTLKRYHRSSFSKAELKRKGLISEDQTEDEFMSGTNMYKIYDSGTTTWILN